MEPHHPAKPHRYRGKGNSSPQPSRSVGHLPAPWRTRAAGAAQRRGADLPDTRGLGRSPRFGKGRGGEQPAAGIKAHRAPPGPRNAAATRREPSPARSTDTRPPPHGRGTAPRPWGLGRSPRFGKGRGGEQPTAGIKARRTYLAAGGRHPPPGSASRRAEPSLSALGAA
ncbi:hypothetical protein SMALA_3293 [Streptomyces malaysiensis subsp. malaysiensis]|nr:hypothetical protein SMALA_3293 [Streptomyces malaysiensis]